jgi:hypothetical protein
VRNRIEQFIFAIFPLTACDAARPISTSRRSASDRDGISRKLARMMGDERAGQGLGVYGAPAGRRGHALTKFSHIQE